MPYWSNSSCCHCIKSWAALLMETACTRLYKSGIWDLAGHLSFTARMLPAQALPSSLKCMHACARAPEGSSRRAGALSLPCSPCSARRTHQASAFALPLPHRRDPHQHVARSVWHALTGRVRDQASYYHSTGGVRIRGARVSTALRSRARHAHGHGHGPARGRVRRRTCSEPSALSRSMRRRVASKGSSLSSWPPPPLPAPLPCALVGACACRLGG